MSTECRTLLKLLDDGQWHSLETITDKVAVSIAPGRALRRYDEREANRRRRRGERCFPELPEDRRIQSGQRNLATTAVNSMKKRYVEIAESDDGRVIRLRPDRPKPLARAGPEEPSPAATDPPPAPARNPDPAAVGHPVCGRCGSLIIDPAKHEEFHRSYDTFIPPPPDVAFMSEEQLRAIIRVEVGQLFDDFQDGLEAYLASCFTELERRLLVNRELPRLYRGGQRP